MTADLREGGGTCPPAAYESKLLVTMADHCLFFGTKWYVVSVYFVHSTVPRT